MGEAIEIARRGELPPWGANGIQGVAWTRCAGEVCAEVVASWYC